MAFVEIYTDSSLLPLFCNVHAPVGPMAANPRPDVLLVQYLLKVFFDATGEANPSGKSLAVDGYAGQITFDHIKAYQAYRCLLHHSSASLRE